MGNNIIYSRDNSISYLELRRAIGILGIALPIVLIVGSVIMGSCEILESSISCYYHTVMRNVFEGIIWIFGIFLIFYRYQRVDNIVTTIAGLCAIGVVLCPTDIIVCTNCTCNEATTCGVVVGYFHLGFASTFFIILAYVSYFLFTRKHPDQVSHPVTAQKLNRNRIYRACGIAMVVCILLIGIYIIWLKNAFPGLANFRPIFWLEALSLWAFGISWLIK